MRQPRIVSSVTMAMNASPAETMPIVMTRMRGNVSPAIVSVVMSLMATQGVVRTRLSVSRTAMPGTVSIVEMMVIAERVSASVRSARSVTRRMMRAAAVTRPSACPMAVAVSAVEVMAIAPVVSASPRSVWPVIPKMMTDAMEMRSA